MAMVVEVVLLRCLPEAKADVTGLGIAEGTCAGLRVRVRQGLQLRLLTSPSLLTLHTFAHCHGQITCNPLTWN